MRKLSYGLALLCLLHLGASTPQNSVKAKPLSTASKSTKAQQSLSAVATPQGFGDGIVQFLGRKTGKELMGEKAAKAPLKGITSQTSSVKKSLERTVASTNLKPGYVPPPPRPRATVPQIRQEIQDILNLNKKIKSLQSGRSAQLQRIQEQARIHQKILNDLEATQKQSGSEKAFSKNALLAQEKLRIIHEETQRNTQAINNLKEMPAKTVTKNAESLKTVAS
ncbi:MAG: hypothetical protein V1882_03355 [Candidatus Omnitrophota bacterium]